MDQWKSATGERLQFQHQNPPAHSIQDSPIQCESTLLHKQPQDPWRSTNERSAQWNKKVEYHMPKKIIKPY
jgi:hypothetical protein